MISVSQLNLQTNLKAVKGEFAAHRMQYPYVRNIKKHYMEGKDTFISTLIQNLGPESEELNTLKQEGLGIMEQLSSHQMYDGEIQSAAITVDLFAKKILRIMQRVGVKV